MNIGNEYTAEFIESKITAKKEFSWSELVEFVEERANVKNWLTGPRSVLQWYINKGLIARISDVHKERYATI